MLLPTDTVYGLCVSPELPEAAALVYRLKGRDASQPLALVAADWAALAALVPELVDPPGALLPGPYTLVLPNLERRLPWLTGSHPETIGVRVPDLPTAARRVLEEFGPVAATSANLSGERDPRRLDDVPAEIRGACAAEVDAGELPGRPSTVLDLTGAEPRVLREGAVPAAEALRALRSASA